MFSKKLEKTIVVNETKCGHPNKQLFSLTFWDFNGYFFFLWSCFFSTIRPLASSDATSYYRPAPGRTDGIPDRDERPCDNGYKSVFTNSWLVRQRNRSWIKGLGKNRQKEWTRSLFSVPFVYKLYGLRRELVKGGVTCSSYLQSHSVESRVSIEQPSMLRFLKQNSNIP